MNKNQPQNLNLVAFDKKSPFQKEKLKLQKEEKERKRKEKKNAGFFLQKKNFRFCI